MRSKGPPSREAGYRSLGQTFPARGGSGGTGPRVLAVPAPFPARGGSGGGTRPGHGPRAAVDEGAGGGGVLEDPAEGRHRWLSPDPVAEAVLARKEPVVRVDEAHDLTGRLDREEGREDQAEPVLHLLVGMLEDAAQGVPDQPDGQGPGQRARLRLVDPSGRQACSERRQLQCGDQALEAEDQPALGSGRVVTTVLVTDAAGAESAPVEAMIPVGTVARPARDVVGEEDPYWFLVDQGHEFRKALSPLAGAAATAEVRVAGAELARIPAGGAGVLLEVIL